MTRKLDIPEVRFSDALDCSIAVLERESTQGTFNGGMLDSGVLQLSMPETLAIVGDIHGDISTFERILDRIQYDKLLENSRNKLILLGDYVDRGPDSLGVLWRIMSLKIDYPDRVIITRGNHEAYSLFPFSGYTLQSDLEHHYPRTSSYLFERLESFFGHMTNATIIDGWAILVHGGLPISLVEPTDAIDQLRERQSLEEILWNDPRDSLVTGDWEKSRRKYGYHFAAPITNRWLDAVGAKLLIRGHEPCMGTRISHSDRALTIFSSKEPYPDFAAAFILASELQKIGLASQLLEFCQLV